MKYTITLIFTLLSNLLWANIGGVYETDCLSYTQKRSFKSTLDIQGNSFGSKFYLYDEQNCQNLILVVDYSSEVNYPAALDVGPMDHQVKSALMIIFDPDLKDKLNKEKFCGKEEIRVGTPVNITGLSKCSPIPVPGKGQILFDMYQKSGNLISFGAHPLLWVHTEEKRPVLTSRVQYRQKK